MQEIYVAEGSLHRLYCGQNTLLLEGDHNLPFGLTKLIEVTSERTEVVDIWRIGSSPVEHIEDIVLYNNGFMSKEDLLKQSPHFNKDTQLTVIHFTLVIGDRPSVGKAEVEAEVKARKIIRRNTVFNALNEEREYQETLRPVKHNDTVPDNKKSLSDFVIYMENQLNEVKKYIYTLNKKKALQHLRKVTGLGVAAMELFGVETRKNELENKKNSK